MNIAKAGFARVSTSLLFKNPAIKFWLAVSFLWPLYFGLISLFYATSSEHIVQDDARLHVVWLQRLVDPDLFVRDAIAHYFTAIQPVGFQLFYRLFALVGIEPLTLAKFLPLLLALVTTGYCFWIALLLLPIPMSGVLTTLLLNQNIWIRDDLIAASPRSFVYPIFSAFLYYLLKDSKVGYLVALGLLGLFYPQMMLVALGILTLRLVQWRGKRYWLPNKWPAYGVWLFALALTLGMLLTFSGQVENEVGQLTSLAEMRDWPEFQLNGRGEYFGVSPLSFWFDGSSGLRFPLFPPIIGLGVLLPLVIRQGKFRAMFPLATHITAQVGVLAQLIASALGLFLLAHIIFPTLYLPSRYTFYSSRFVLILASGLMMTLVLQRWLMWLRCQWWRFGQWQVLDYLKVGVSGGFAIAVLVTPAVPFLFLGGQGWVVGETPGLYREVARLPKDAMIASLVREVNDNIPAFSERSVLVGREFALPYHVAFYDEMRQRAVDLVNAQYSLEIAEVQSFVEKYGVDLWILSVDFLQPDYLSRQGWLVNSSMQGAVVDAIATLETDKPVALTTVIPICSVQTGSPNFIVLDANCVMSSV